MLVASLLDVVGDQQHVGVTGTLTRYDTSLKAHPLKFEGPLKLACTETEVIVDLF